MRLTSVRIVAVALTLVLLVACGEADEVVSSDGPGPSEPVAGSSSQRYTATGMVLESSEHGPQLCLGGVEESYPPQCGGPDVIGWSWDAVDGEESAGGTTWAEYTVVGTWDGEALTLTEQPSAPDRDEQVDDTDRLETPCPEPEGGWRVVEPETATDAAMQAAIEHARAQPDVGGVWIDQSVNPAAGREPVEEEAMNDPSRLVLNVTFTGDLARHEPELRERWGGALCVSEAAASAAALEGIRSEVEAEVGDAMTYSSVDEVLGRVEVGVHVDEGFQAAFDARYGEGAVRVEAALRPVDA